MSSPMAGELHRDPSAGELWLLRTRCGANFDVMGRSCVGPRVSFGVSAVPLLDSVPTGSQDYPNI